MGEGLGISKGPNVVACIRRPVDRLDFVAKLSLEFAQGESQLLGKAGAFSRFEPNRNALLSARRRDGKEQGEQDDEASGREREARAEAGPASPRRRILSVVQSRCTLGRPSWCR